MLNYCVLTYSARAKIASSVSLPVGTSCFCGRRKPCSPVSRNSTPYENLMPSSSYVQSTLPPLALSVIYKCPCLNNLRQTFIPLYYFNLISIFKLIELFKSENRNVLIKLCKFIELAFNHSNSLISRQVQQKVKIYSQIILCFVLLLYQYVLFIYWVFIVSVYSVTLCLWVFFFV